MAASSIVIPGGTFLSDGHIYRDQQGRRVLSVTQIFERLGMNDYANVRKEVLLRKAEIGVATHKAVELLLLGRLDWDTVDDRIMGYTVGAETWFRRAGFKLAEAEHQGIHEVSGLKYGYQYDQRGWMSFGGRQRSVIVDLKTMVETSPTWPIQIAAYSLAAPPLPNGEKYLRVVLHLHKDGPAKAHYFDDPRDERTFLHMAYVATWMQNQYGAKA